MYDNSNDIELLFFSSKFDEHFDKLSEIIQTSFPADKIFKCSTIIKFSTKLKDLLFGLSILLVVVRNKNELNEIYLMRERLRDLSVILVLAQDIDDMSKQAIRLYPRYTTYMKNDYNDIFQVLNKMRNNMQNKIEGDGNGRSY